MMTDMDGRLHLAITHQLPRWSQDSEADARNRRLIREFRQAVPESASMFAGLIVTAQEEGGGRSYRTTEALGM
jgi:hypothetical protein